MNAKIRKLKNKLAVVNILINLMTCMFIIASVIHHWKG